MTFPTRTVYTACLIVLLSAAAFAGEVVVPFISGQADFMDTGAGQVRLQAAGFSSEVSPGDPALPSTDRYLLLPPDADLRSVRVEIRDAVQEKVPGTFSVAPTPPIVAYVDGRKLETWGSGKDIRDGRDALVYEKDAFYPANYVTLDYAQRLDSYQLLPIRFWPYRYNPATGDIIHLASANVAITFDSLATTTAAAVGVLGDADRLRRLAINWQQASQWYPAPSGAQAASAATALAIVTTSAIANVSTKLNDYISHKANEGFTVTLVTEAEWGGGTGDTASENLRAWLKANYLNNFRYLLLIGNPNPSTGDVPMKMTWPRHGAGDGYEDAPTDYYYADLTGNWDLNGNGFYGEDPGDFGVGGIDRIPELIVGRIPYYGSTAGLDKILQKIITYESAITVGGWVQKVLLPMKPLDDQTPMYQLGEAIKAYTAIPAGLQYYRLYDSTYSLSPAPETTPCSESGVLAEWKKHYGFVFWSTHGSNTSASSVFSSSNCPNLDDDYPSFVFQASCLNGYPETTSNLGYSLLKNGAISTVSASRVSWYYPGQTSYSGTDSDPGMAYTYSLRVAKDRQKCGDALFNMKTSLPRTIWMNHVVFNLYGDPTVATRVPTTFAIEPIFLPDGKVGRYYSADVHASGGTPPYTWTLVGGTLPDNLLLSASGTIFGTPQKAGVYNLSLRCTDSAGTSIIGSGTLVISQTLYSFTLDTNPGWTCDDGWAYGTPTGGGSHNYDPTSGHTGTKVYGYNLQGDYANGMATVQHLTTQAIDCGMIAHTSLSFWRWLGVESSTYDHVSIEVSNDGANWTTIWSNPTTTITDTAWTQQVYDISAIADGQKTVYVRWGIGSTDASGTYPGWNIDDVEIGGGPTRPLIRHIPYGTTDITTGNYTIDVDVLFASTPTANPVLHWSTGGGFIDVTMTKMTTYTYRALVPAQPSGTTVSYYITAADASGSSSLPSDAPTTCFQFDVITDTEPPVITHTPLADTADTSGVYPVVATVTDNLGVASVSLTWTKDGGTATTVPMNKTDNPNEYRASIQSQTAVGDWLSYKITATDTSVSALESTNPSSGWNTFNILPGKTPIYSVTLTTDPGWSCEGLWNFGIPIGGGSGKKDPVGGHTGNNVYGYNLNGDYASNMATAEYLTSTAFDLTGITGVTLKFWRWLGVEKSTYDHASIEVSTDGTDWTTVWSNPSSTTIDDGGWLQQSYDVSAIADGQPTVYFRWGMGTTDASVTYCGWNIDDIEIWGDNYPPADGVTSIKGQPDGRSCLLANRVVTAAFNGFFYIQDPENFQGIKVIWSGTVTEGSPVTIRGVVRTRDGERELLAASVQ